MNSAVVVSTSPHTLSVAPMMDWTDRHCRVFHRLLSRRALLYTEMVTTGALLHGSARRHLDFDPSERPVALQLGGSDPSALAQAAKMGEAWGYDEINLNVGCPSDRVQNGSFGACLMATPDVVARGVAAMRGAVGIPVTVKHRIGIGGLDNRADQDSYEELHHFVSTVAAAGCQTFIVHARKAILKGLSPKQNREIPPLRYEVVQRVKQDFPGLSVVLNGGVKSLADAHSHLSWADGVMIGREAYQHPYLLAGADSLIFGEATLPPTRREVIGAYLPYVAAQLEGGVYLSHLTRHILGLFAGQSGARHWKRTLSERSHLPGAGVEVILDAVAGIPDGALDARFDNDVANVREPVQV